MHQAKKLVDHFSGGDFSSQRPIEVSEPELIRTLNGKLNEAYEWLA